MVEQAIPSLARPPVVRPGSLLRTAREAKGLEQADVASSLNWLPGYVVLIEEDRHQELRSPAFGRGYVKTYARLVGISQPRILRALDEWEEECGEAASADAARTARGSRKPPQLQKSGAGVYASLTVLGMLMMGLWFWHDGLPSNTQTTAVTSQPASSTAGGGAE